jgi:hypothetical protein
MDIKAGPIDGAHHALLQRKMYFEITDGENGVVVFRQDVNS